MVLIVVILALAAIAGVVYFIATLVYYLKKDENGNRLGIMKFITDLEGFHGLLIYIGMCSTPVLISLIVIACLRFLGIIEI